ncbi:MAG: HAD-IG family 5'-nucleotidase [Candidatus Wallbacteria bacterium]|nr:HAD-IG family 5'-nucleotidase [Candidatus Wallbacteria bacterium]
MSATAPIMKRKRNVFYLDTIEEFPYQTERNISKAKRVFVNRNLKMKSIRMIGFDMDHTLAMYNKVMIEQLAFDMTKRKMVEEKGYAADVLELKYDPEFVIRGLVVDKTHGNVLKLDKHQYVVTVYHGKQPLSREMRKVIYTNKRPDLANPEFYSVDTLFSIPEVALYAEMISAFEVDGKTFGKTPQELFDDIRFCIDKTHRDGTLKAQILAEPELYFVKDPNLALSLDKFIRSGKVLFLLTNSKLDYTEAVMSYLLNGEMEQYPDWTDYFEFVLVDSGKPEFFLKGTPMKALLTPDYTAKDKRLGVKRAKVYERGSSQQFEEVAGFRGEEVLYVGDHTFGDILRSKKSSGWRTAMVIEELEREVQVAERVRGLNEELDKLEELRNELRFQSNLVSEKIEQIRETKMQDYEKKSATSSFTRPTSTSRRCAR